jgi:hypothetical protein
LYASINRGCFDWQGKSKFPYKTKEFLLLFATKKSEESFLANLLLSLFNFSFLSFSLDEKETKNQA